MGYPNVLRRDAPDRPRRPMKTTARIRSHAIVPLYEEELYGIEENSE